MLLKKKKNLRPGEGYSVYKSKPAASGCNGILLKKKKKFWFDNSPFRFESITNVKNRQGVKKNKEQVLS